MDLADIGTPRLSWRRFRNIIARLPPTSAYRGEVSGPGFSTEAHLLDMLLLVTRFVHHDKGPDPKPMLPQQSGKALVTAPLPPERMRDELAKWRRGETPNFS